MRFGARLPRRRKESPDHPSDAAIDSPGVSPAGDSIDGFEVIVPLDVRPAEVEPDSPWPVGNVLPAAMCLDFGDAADGMVAIRAGSLRGNSHQELSQPRQDAYAVLADDRFIHLAVADGVGSQTHSHIGAETAVQTALEFSRSGAGAAEIADAVVRNLQAKASAIGLDPVRLSTTLCWARVTIGAKSTSWTVEVAEWGDSELLIYDTRGLRNGHPKWQRLRKVEAGTANSVLALPAHRVIQAQSSDSLWHPREVLGLYSDGIAADIRHDTVLGHALAKSWHTIPTPWEFVGQLAFRYGPANDDRTAVILWRRDGHQEHVTHADVDVEVPERHIDAPDYSDGGPLADEDSAGAGAGAGTTAFQRTPDSYTGVEK